MEILEIYKDKENWKEWKSQLDYEKQFFHCAILLVQSNIIQGQVICYNNPFHKIEGEPSMSVGNIHLPEDKKLLLHIHQRCINVATNLGAKHIISPMNGSTWNNYRFVSKQLYIPFFLEPKAETFLYNGFREIGYKKLASYYSQMTETIVDNWERSASRYSDFLADGVTFSGFDRAFAQKEFQSLASFCNQAFRKNFLFSPIEEEDFVAKMSQILPIINPDYTIIARHNDKIVGFIFAYRDPENTESKTLIIKTLARDLDRKYGGMGSVLSSLVFRKAISDGFTQSIHALMIETNASVALSKKFHGKIISHYELLYFSL